MTTPTPDGSDAPERPLYATLARRTAIAIVLVLILTVPTVVLYLITHQMSVTWASVAGIIGIAAVATSGRKLAFIAAGITAALTPVAIVAGSVPIAAAGLMAIMCLIVGLSSRLGLHRVILLIPVFMSWMLLSPPTWGGTQTVNRTDPDYLLWMTVVFFVGVAFPAIVLPPLLKKVQLPAPVPSSRSDAATYTVTITILTTGATYVLAEYFPQLAGAWLIATILVLTQVGNVGTVKMTVSRVVGTVLGVLIVGGLLATNLSFSVLFFVGLATMVAAIVAKFGPHYWVFMTLITPTVILLNASSAEEAAGLNEQRVEFTGMGAVLVLVSSAITVAYSHWENTRGDGPTQETPAVAGGPATVPLT